MRLNHVKQYCSTLSDAIVEVNNNSSKTSALSEKFNKSEDNSNATFYPGSHTNRIISK